MALTLGAFIPPIVGLLSALFNRSSTFLRFNDFFLLSFTFLACTKKIDNSKFQFVDLIIDTLIIGSLSICLVFFALKFCFFFHCWCRCGLHTQTHSRSYTHLMEFMSVDLSNFTFPQRLAISAYKPLSDYLWMSRTQKHTIHKHTNAHTHTLSVTMYVAHAWCLPHTIFYTIIELIRNNSRNFDSSDYNTDGHKFVVCFCWSVCSNAVSLLLLWSMES